jgi:hypothetical protein
MSLTSIPEPRGAQRHFRGANPRSRHGNRDKNVGLADVVVVEEVYAARFEIVDVQSPTANRNRDAELMLLIALAMQRLERSRVAGHG